MRQSVLPSEGCTICKCKGCHPEEVLYKKRGGGGWVSSQSSSSNVNYPMYGYYPPYFPYLGPYTSSDHYNHPHGSYESRGYPRYEDWYYDRIRSPERHHERKQRRLDEPLSRKRERVN